MPLVSREHVDRHFSGYRRRWFDQYAWPVTPDTHVIWSEDPEERRPINRFLRPEHLASWHELVAARDIPSGEQLTIDYATFCGPGMEPFECRCGAADCRHEITGTDHLLPAIRERYRDHVSDFVRSQWRQGPGAPVPELYRNGATDNQGCLPNPGTETGTQLGDGNGYAASSSSERPAHSASAAGPPVEWCAPS